MGVRVDREGTMARDYHTAGGEYRIGSTLGFDARGKPIPYGVAKADGSRPEPVVSKRYYLADADFLIGLEGPHHLLTRLDQTLAVPVWQLYLGRKAFVPGEPVRLPNGSGLLPEADVEAALKSFPWRKRGPDDEKPDRIRLVLECDLSEGEPRLDVPESFAERRFHLRHVKTELWPMAALQVAEEEYA
jgi:CRISPR system Cascade subunit CasD